MHLRVGNETIIALAVPDGEDGSIYAYAQKDDGSAVETFFKVPLRRTALNAVRNAIKERHPDAKVDTLTIVGESTCRRKEVPLDRIEAAFIDRDGVLNHNDQSLKGGPIYTLCPSDIIIPEGIPDSLGWLTQMGILNFVITMQNCIVDGLASVWEIEEVHQQMRLEWEASGGKIEAIYTCTTDDEDDLVKAKAKAKVIRHICERWDLNVASTIVIGDSSYDIEAGIIAGCGWEIQTRVLKDKKTRARTIAGNFYEAVDIIWRSLHEQGG